MSDERVMDFGNAWSAFADGMQIERHGSVTHLVFTMAQELDFNGNVRQVITARVILPTELLAIIGKKLMAPPRTATGVLQVAVH